MNRPMRLNRHYRLLYFAALYVVYLGVLFFTCTLGDSSKIGHTAVRVLAPLFELGLLALVCAVFVRVYRDRKAWYWLIPSAAVAGVAGIVYFAQVYSLYLSNNFISVLALQNTESMSFVTSPLLALGILACLAWWGFFCAGQLYNTRRSAIGVERWSGRFVVTVIFLLCLINAWLLSLQNKNAGLEPGFRQAPVVNLVANVYIAKFGHQEQETVEPRTNGEGDCFTDPAPVTSSDYPFQKTWVFRSPLTFPAVATASGQSNVIIIFTEGTSARLIGAYGGEYPGLTPNIDHLASRTMRVVNYFNHTAATYRGLIGQLSSGYPFAGGSGKAGWETGDNKQSLRTIRRMTLPMILDKHGYQSYFFSPHKSERPFTLMLNTLGFDRVFTYESIGKQLLKGQFLARQGTAALDDQSLFRGVIAFLEQRHASSNDKPFFIGTYNIGTHAFVGTDASDIKYRDGASSVLNKLHNYDAALGQFLRYFYRSPYADNTILVFTSDHATYPETAYRKVAGKDLRPFFVDRIPLLIDDPRHTLPRVYDADGRNSLDLAPTILQLLDIRNAENSFLGRSLFEPRDFVAGMAGLGNKLFLTTKKHGVFSAETVPHQLRGIFQCEADVVRRYYKAERENRLVEP